MFWESDQTGGGVRGAAENTLRGIQSRRTGRDTGSDMHHEKFDIAHIERLDDEGRFRNLPPELMWRALGEPAPRAIVDIGAGTGLFARRFAELAPQAEVYAVDIEPRMIAWMRDHTPDPLRARLHALLGSENAVPVASGEADLVVMINLHHELVDAPRSYAEAFRVLRGGGQLLVVDWAPGDGEHGPPQAIRATPEEIGAMVTSAGFDAIAFHPGLPDHSLLTARRPMASS